ncbi:uncharacterized protein LOC134730552 [Pan paniscus]|uniref:uncharacterized protein LOC134730552 n=1 Tax=Pan paniscus TaxID=9597 RepID=UPI0030071966
MAPDPKWALAGPCPLGSRGLLWVLHFAASTLLPVGTEGGNGQRPTPSGPNLINGLMSGLDPSSPSRYDLASCVDALRERTCPLGALCSLGSPGARWKGTTWPAALWPASSRGLQELRLPCTGSQRLPPSQVQKAAGAKWAEKKRTSLRKGSTCLRREGACPRAPCTWRPQGLEGGPSRRYSSLSLQKCTPAEPPQVPGCCVIDAGKEGSADPSPTLHPIPEDWAGTRVSRTGQSGSRGGVAAKTLPRPQPERRSLAGRGRDRRDRPGNCWKCRSAAAAPSAACRQRVPASPGRRPPPTLSCPSARTLRLSFTPARVGIWGYPR